jgi:hypothetical protein
MSLPFKRLGTKYFVGNSIGMWGVFTRLDDGTRLFVAPTRADAHKNGMAALLTRAEARAECKRLNAPGSKWATQQASRGFVDSTFIAYMNSCKIREDIISHIPGLDAHNHGKAINRRVAIYHLYIANRV